MKDTSHIQSNDCLIEKPDDIKIAPVSPSQRRLWFYDILSVTNDSYNLNRVYKITGALNKEILAKSITKLFANQKSLHTIFREKEGKLFQIVLPARKIALPEVAMTHFPIDEVLNESNELVKNFIEKPFDISKWPLFRICLFNLENDEYLFCLAMHHIISDWWSMGLMFNQLSVIYNSMVIQNSLDLPELKMQYTDYTIQKLDEFERGIYEAQLNYWKEKLTGSSELNIPHDYVRPEFPKKSGRLITIEIPDQVSQKIKHICFHKKVSLFVFLLSAFGIVLRRISGNRDINIGIPIANRNGDNLEDIIGFFINIIVIRLNCSDNLSFFEYLSETKNVAYKAYDNQDVPFEKIVETINPSRNSNKNPLFQVFFNMLNSNDASFSLNKAEIQRIKYNFNIKSYFDFTIYITDKKNTISFTALYDTDIFKEVTIKNILEQYSYILSQLAENPEKSVSSYSIRTIQSNNYLPNPKKHIDSSFGDGNQLSIIFKNSNSNKTALSYENEDWSYNEIDELSNKFSSCLLNQGLRQGDVIAVFTDRSPALVLSIISIIKIDGVFSIFDPENYPKEKIEKQLDVIHPKATIHIKTNKDDIDNIFIELKNRPAINIELPAGKNNIYEQLKKYDEAPGLNAKEADSDCYINFTSGSTGEPKAILGSLSPVSSFVKHHVKTYQLTSSYRFSMLSGLTHDPLLRDIFIPLSLSATLFIPNNDLIKSIKLAGWLDKNEINIINITPSLGRILVHKVDEPVSSIKLIFCGGEPLDGSLVEKLKRKFPCSRIINCYGATETPQIVSYCEIQDSFFKNYSAGKIETIHIGSQTETAQLLVIKNDELAGIGEIGEIWVRTPYLSKGYYNDISETEKKFIPNPFTTYKNDKIYKTGDLGRYNADGDIEFLGRMDRQIKIRGHRIDLYETEIAIKQYHSIENCAVLATVEKANEITLHAFYISENSISSLAIKAYLRQVIPEYMIPLTISKINSLPLTPNGKIKYDLLKNFIKEVESVHAKVPPAAPLEKQIAGYWAEILGLREISMTDNFFDIGGHSLKAIEVISAIKEKLNIDIVFRDFINNNLGQFCKLCESKMQIEK